MAPHAPFTASANLYRRCEEIADREDILLTTHLAESREEMSMFGDARGPLYDFLKGIGPAMSDFSDETPVEKFLVERVTKIDRTYLLVHLNEMTQTDFELFAASKGRFSVVHCPRSHAYFEHSPFQFEKLRALGLNICLGTDSLASNVDLSLFAEMRAFQKEFPNVSPEEILKMVTSNPARALRRSERFARNSLRTSSRFRLQDRQRSSTRSLRPASRPAGRWSEAGFWPRRGKFSKPLSFSQN
ncbi:MAG: hypothetical protein DME57_08785 [Verrucomicrobia bacterium]|nr:MAG: hypothetical protein DME57_08785 [Verrucomicrobiota bacterium]